MAGLDISGVAEKLHRGMRDERMIRAGGDPVGDRAATKKLEDKRLQREIAQGAAMDGLAIVDFLQQGKVEQAKEKNISRLQAIIDAGRDPGDTMRIQEMLDNGETDKVMDELGGMVREFSIKVPEFGKNSEVQRVVGNLTGQRVAGGTSAKTETFKNGTVIQSDNRGIVHVISPDGTAVEGPERIKVLKAARQADLEHARALSGERAAGSKAIARSDEMFKQIESIDKAALIMEEGISALREGADTGPIMSRLPSISAASQKLDNVQSRLGLNIISNTTFGALSAGEMALALSTALPSGLQPDELSEWMREKLSATQKLRNYLEDAAIFLGTPGNTVSTWNQLQKDARGNRAGSGSDSIPTINSQEEYDALPPGSEYWDGDTRLRKE